MNLESKVETTIRALDELLKAIRAEDAPRARWLARAARERAADLALKLEAAGFRVVRDNP